jgi:hypothetical protein
MNNEVIANLMLSGVIFALTLFAATVGIAVAVSAYLFGVALDSSVLVGILGTLVVLRGLTEFVIVSLNRRQPF